jgi:succinate-semialdehyde dehydrogenase / glutarate-semialdehyde dehydrogenase
MSDYAVVNPATGQTVQTYPTISDDALEVAIASADQAHRSWSRSSTVAERAALIRRVSELHTERRAQLAAIIVREMGKPVEQALAEVDFSADIYKFYADNAEALMQDEPITLLAGEGSALIRRSSLGVLLGIMPWNFPYYQVARFAGPNLVVGNTILLKHASQCPESAAAIEQIFRDAGFPEGAYVNIYATNEQIASAIADPRVQGVSLTGSARAGAAVAEVAGRNLKKVVLELGGSDPFILLDTTDLDAAVESAVAARLDNSGQSCNAAKRFMTRSWRSSPPRSPAPSRAIRPTRTPCSDRSPPTMRPIGSRSNSSVPLPAGRGSSAAVRERETSSPPPCSPM